ncbi:MAG TPA: ATP synthase F1 subunit gamma [Anaerolineae bacterium]
MPSPRVIQRRIKSINKISQVTHAYEMIAASKVRRAQQATLATRPYAEKSWEMLTYLAAQPGRGKVLHPLLEERAEIKSILLLLTTSDRGLCGAYNVNVIRAATEFAARQNTPVRFITIGRRGTSFAARYGKEIVAEFSGLSERPTIVDVGAISKIAIDEFIAGRADEVHLAYTDYVNTLVQRPVTHRLLPIQPAQETHTGMSAVYLYEPNPETILASVLPRFTEMQIYQAILESVASEWAARMVAMRSATDNAHDLIEDLTLAMNKARQASITKEILDIMGGAEAQREARAK